MSSSASNTKEYFKEKYKRYKRACYQLRDEMAQSNRTICEQEETIALLKKKLARYKDKVKVCAGALNDIDEQRHMTKEELVEAMRTDYPSDSDDNQAPAATAKPKPAAACTKPAN